MAETEGHSNSPFPDFLLRMGPIFNRADVRAAQVTFFLFFLEAADDWSKVRLVGSKAIFARADFKMRRLQGSKQTN